ncbi:MAG: S8 family serine peptidase [Alphaproteobacteria bacterium]|nr:S8 family serine peptidase [Alphaproteobacteria bacterium]
MQSRFLYLVVCFVLLLYGGRIFWQKTSFSPLKVMEVSYAHQRNLTGKGLIVAVLDEGFDASHGALKPQLSSYRYNTANQRNDVSETVVFSNGSFRFESHGTHVAGIIANVAPDAKIIPIKVQGFDGDQDFVKALQIASKSPAHIVNISLRLSHTGRKLSPNVYAALIKLAQSGKIIVIAAGNEGVSLMKNAYTASLVQLSHDPEMQERLILAGALSYKNGSESLAEFSNFPGNSSSGISQTYFITAPGEDILSTITGGYFGEKSGTSMAAPMVVGALCLLMQAFPESTPENVARLLLTSARKVSIDSLPVSLNTFGQGIVDLKAALDKGWNISRGALL